MTSSEKSKLSLTELSEKIRKNKERELKDIRNAFISYFGICTTLLIGAGLRYSSLDGNIVGDDLYGFMFGGGVTGSIFGLLGLGLLASNDPPAYP